MSNFESKWARRQGSSLGEKVRESIAQPGPLKPRIEDAARKLEGHVSRLDSTLAKLKQKDSTIFHKVSSAVQAHDIESSKALSNELAEVRKMTKMVSQANLAIRQITLRLNTVRDFGDIANTLAPAIGVIRSVRSGLASMAPHSELGEISEELSSLLVDAGHIGGLNINFQVANEDAERILAEASAVAEQKMKENLPSVPTDVQLDSRT